MPDQLSADQILQGLQGQLANIIAEFRILISCFPLKDEKRELPDAVAYEFQHAMVHLAFSSTTDPYSTKKRNQQYRSAVEHLERGILDGWKLLLFAPCIHAKACSAPAWRKELIACRLDEYREIAGITPLPNENGTFTHTSIKKYCALYMEVTEQDKPSLAAGTGLASNFDPKCFALLHTWGQYELILCSLLGEKDLGMLDMLLETVLNDFSVPALQHCIGALAQSILRELLKLNEDFPKWIAANPELYSEAERACAGMTQSPRDSTLFRKFFQKQVLPYYGITIRTFEKKTG